MMRITRNQKGFTLIELLIVVAIIGILAAIAIPNLLTAMQRSKQKRSMADIRSAATAWEAYATDGNSYTAAGATLVMGDFKVFTYPSLKALLSPTYIRNTPQFDGWGGDFLFYVDNVTAGEAEEYIIISPGRDGTLEGGDYVDGTTNVFECDIVYSMGGFVKYPDGVQVSATN